MNNSLHHMIMADHMLFQKDLLGRIRNTGLTSGQPKVLEYLLSHDGSVQKELATACYIEPATLTSVLNGMEKKGLIQRKTESQNRRSLHVYLTPKGRTQAQEVNKAFASLEEKALQNFTGQEQKQLMDLLQKLPKRYFISY